MNTLNPEIILVSHPRVSDKNEEFTELIFFSDRDCDPEPDDPNCSPIDCNPFGNCRPDCSPYD